MFKGKKANLGMTIFIGLLLFQMGMYIFIRSANADPNFSNVGSYSENSESFVSTTSSEDLTTSEATGLLDGFDITVFGLPWWANIFYGLFQVALILLSGFAMVRGLS